MSSAPPVLPPLQAAVALALLLGMQPVLTDLYLPALPAITAAFGAPLAQMQMTMSALILAFGLSQLVWGPIADRFGRRPVLLASLALMVVASVGAAHVTSVDALVGWRTAQGATLAASVVCARAMVRDLYEPTQGAQAMALGLSGLGVIAIVVPVAGGLLVHGWGWRAALAAVAVFALASFAYVAWRVPETLPAARRDPHALDPRVFARNARSVLAHPAFRAWALLVAGTYGGLFIVLSASSYAYIGVLGLSAAQYGLTMAGGSLVYLAGTFVCRRWIVRFGLPGTVARGAPFTLAGGLLMGACALAVERPPLPAVLLAHALYTFGHGLHQPCGQTGAVAPFPRMAGVASALAGLVLASVAFAIGLWLGRALDGTLRPLGVGLAVASIVTATVAWTLVRRHGRVR